MPHVHVPMVAKSYVQRIVRKALRSVGEIMKDMPLLQIQHYGVPQYELQNAVTDEGTFGQVCMGLHRRTSEMVAVKLVEKRRLKDYVDLKRLVREVRSAKRVRHENVVQMFEVVDGKYHVQIVMEMMKVKMFIVTNISRVLALCYFVWHKFLLLFVF